MEKKKEYFKIGEYYLHYTPLKLIFWLMLFVSMAGFVYIDDSNWGSLLSLLFCTFFLVLTFVILIRYSKQEKYPKNPSSIFNNELAFSEGQIIVLRNTIFPRKSRLRKLKFIDANIISEANINRWPLEIVINQNEVIFINPKQEKELVAFCKINDIAIIERFDIWEAISRPYLDTELDQEEHDFLFQKLKENGFEKEEVLRIRKKVRFGLFAITFATWEWMHYGHWDVLKSLFQTKKNYWWTMEIALRNFKPKANTSL